MLQDSQPLSALYNLPDEAFASSSSSSSSSALDHTFPMMATGWAEYARPRFLWNHVVFAIGALSTRRLGIHRPSPRSS